MVLIVREDQSLQPYYYKTVWKQYRLERLLMSIFIDMKTELKKTILVSTKWLSKY